MAAPTKRKSQDMPKNDTTRKEVEVVTFHNPSKRKKEEKNEATTSKPTTSKTSDHPVFNLESARAEVRQLGITGLHGRSKIMAELTRLKHLGAKIPKNWERRMERKKRYEELQRQKQDLKAGVKTKVKGNPQKKSKPEKREEKGFIDGQVGTYRNGVQYISKEDIRKVLGRR